MTLDDFIRRSEGKSMWVLGKSSSRLRAKYGDNCAFVTQNRYLSHRALWAQQYPEAVAVDIVYAAEGHWSPRALRIAALMIERDGGVSSAITALRAKEA